MDPIGFAIGVVSLASIVSTCIEGFHIFKSIRGYEHDAETIMLKLEIERALFIEWAHSVGLLRKHYVNANMFSPKADKLVHDVLVKIKQLLDEAEALARKYGLIEDESWKSCFDSSKTRGEWCHCDRHRTKHRHRPANTSPSPSSSSSLASSPSSSRPGDGTGRSATAKPPLSRKFMWTIQAKGEFESLIEQLHYFIERLDQMVKSVNQRQMLLKDLRGLGADFSKLDLVEGDDDKWSVQSSDGRSSTAAPTTHRHDGGGVGGYEDWGDDVMTTFSGCSSDNTIGGRTGYHHSRRSHGDSGASINTRSKSNPRLTRRSGRYRNAPDDGNFDPPPPYISSTSLSDRRRHSPSSSKTTTAIYKLSDRGSSSSGSSRSGSRGGSQRPSSWLSGSSDFY